MQTTKEDTRRLLQDTAREAFLKKGFKAVSMREISKLSGVGLSNIYNYYTCKEELLGVVLRPLLETMNDMLVNHSGNESLSLEVYTSEEYHRRYMHEVLEVITRYRQELRLLFLDGQETYLRDYCDQWVDKGTSLGMEYMERMGNLFPALHTSVSSLFIRFTCSVWINMIREIVLKEDLSSDEMECFISEYIHFCTGGWKRVMKVGSQSEMTIDNQSDETESRNAIPQWNLS